jgi:hypothetical protein
VVEVILGTLPAPLAVVTAETIRTLRAPDGARPCAEGLRAALRWIGDRSLPFEAALAEARKKIARDFVEWAIAALSYGYGYGYGSGSGSGSGYGSGYGDGDG